MDIVRYIISQLKKHEIKINDIPDELEDNLDIIKTERVLGLRKTYRCGYDVIRDCFFVEEDVLYRDEESGWSHLSPVYFEDFTSYCNYMDGNIYENACYYQMDLKKVPESIDKDKLFARKSLTEKSITDYTLFPTAVEQTQYDEAEKRKVQLKKWMGKFDNCTTFQHLRKTTKDYEQCELRRIVDVSFFFWIYIFKDVNNDKRFKIIMDYMSSGAYPEYKISPALCAIYNPDDVVDNYKYENGSYQTCRKHIRTIKQVADNVKRDQYKYTKQGFFDEKSHFYCIETKAYEQGRKWPVFSYRQYFDAVSDLIDYLGGDLRSCDLSKAYNIQIDYSHYIVDKTTKLPINYDKTYEYSVNKSYCNDAFEVIQTWKDTNGSIVKSYKHKFKYFFDFVAFLNGDLKDADLVSCDGLEHINPTD